MSKHEWKLERGNVGDKHPLFISRQSGVAVRLWDDETTRLAATSPELLAACKELISDIYLLDPSCQKGLIEHCRCRQCTRDRAKAAIAKAELGWEPKA